MNKVRRHRLQALMVTLALMALPAINAPAPAAAEGDEYRLVRIIRGPTDPVGVAVYGVGQVYVADTGEHGVQVFDSQGTFLSKWGSRGSGDGQFYSPHGVAVDGAGRVYVADTDNHRVQVFDSQGTYLRKWGSLGSGDGQFDRPKGVAVDGGGKVYVADMENHRIQVFDSQGTFLSKWGSRGSGDGQFYSPHGVAVDGGVGSTWPTRTTTASRPLTPRGPF